MIELRWVERSEPLPHDPRIAHTVRVLQYRKLEIGVPIIEENVLKGYERKWTDWIDVPTVR